MPLKGGLQTIDGVRSGGVTLMRWLQHLRADSLRYLASSGGTWVVDFATFMPLYQHLGVPLALLISRCSATAFGFLAHKFFSFQARSKPSTREIVGYVVIASLNFVITALFLSAFASDDEWLTAILKLTLEVALFLINYFFLRALFLGQAGKA